MALAHSCSELIDISLPITPALPVWPGDPRPALEPVTTLESHGVQVSRLILSTHAGTHVDAPRHFIPGGRSIDALDLATLFGPCRVIEVIGADRQVSREHLQGCELQPGERILLKTRNSRLPVARTFASDFVALELSAAEHLAECQVRLVGVDGPSVDVWGASDFPCHKHLLGADIVILENLALCHVVPGIYGLIAMPLNLVGADGCPVRAVLTPLQGLPHLPA